MNIDSQDLNKAIEFFVLGHEKEAVQPLSITKFVEKLAGETDTELLAQLHEKMVSPKMLTQYKIANIEVLDHIPENMASYSYTLVVAILRAILLSRSRKMEAGHFNT